jgi:hypothetical protein
MNSNLSHFEFGVAWIRKISAKFAEFINPVIEKRELNLPMPNFYFILSLKTAKHTDSEMGIKRTSGAFCNGQKPAPIP